MAEILTRKGDRIIVDDEDFEALNAHRWCLDIYGYARHAEPTGLPEPRQRIVYMHRMLLGLVPGDCKYADHINGDRLDNRRANLRVCTNAENGRNRGAQKRNTSGFKGVRFEESSGKWIARIGIDYSLKYLGRFETPDLAHELYCLAADMLHGEFANHGETL